MSSSLTDSAMLDTVIRLWIAEIDNLKTDFAMDAKELVESVGRGLIEHVGTTFNIQDTDLAFMFSDAYDIGITIDEIQYNFYLVPEGSHIMIVDQDYLEQRENFDMSDPCSLDRIKEWLITRIRQRME